MRSLYALLTLLVLMLLLPLGSAVAGPAAARGAAIAHACAACHGPDGHSQGPIPSLYTLSTPDFIAALKAFRTEARNGTVMNRIAKGLDDAAIEAVAHYFATLPRR